MIFFEVSTVSGMDVMGWLYELVGVVLFAWLVGLV
jgi:hypothetical protein